MKLRWLFGVLMLFAIPISCLAAENRGYIRLTMAYDGQTVAGGTVTLYDVSNCPEEIDPLEMLVYVKELGIPGVEKQVSASGQVIFNDLPAGYYLLVQQKAAKGYYPMNPFLIRLAVAPGGSQVTCIDAAPKLAPEKKLPQTGQLIWPAWVFIGGGGLFIGIGLFHRKETKRYLQE